MMESARLKADIVPGLGADDSDEDVPEKDFFEEPARKQAMSQKREDRG